MFRPPSILTNCFVLWLGGSFVAVSNVAAMPTDSNAVELGRSLYAQQCAECHGGTGQGEEGLYPDPLIGDASIGELAKTIHDTMPEGSPEECVDDEARAVAAYIHETFYSEAARIRNRPPRLSLSRLTAPQLRQSLADLYAHFGSVYWMNQERGLTGTYFDGDRWKDDKKKIERVDEVIDFDFAHDGPGEGIDAKAFLIYWEGALRPEVSGLYEIIVHSTCSFTMHLGHRDRIFFDNKVQSGDKTEFRRSIYLTAGRIYPLKIEYVQRKRITDLPPARISLSWTPPHRVAQIIPKRNLIPGWSPPVFSLQTHLPPDDRSYGYERGISISRQWDESTTYAALEFADVAVEELWPEYLKKASKESGGDKLSKRDQLQLFLLEIAEVGFRGTLDADARMLYVNRQIEGIEDDAEAIKRSLLLILKSPRFLYPALEQNATTSRTAANRLALAMFDSLPADKWLLEAAESELLINEAQVREAAWRMLDDHRTRAKTRDFFAEWLNLGHVNDIAKNQEQYAGFTEQIVGDLRDSLLLTLDDITWEGSSDFREFFSASTTFTTPRLAEFYGQGWNAGDDAKVDHWRENEFVRSQPDPVHRHGILNHPLLMSGLAYFDSTSPIHRGVFLIRYLLGRTLRPPGDAFSPLSPDLHPDLNTRERVALQTSPESCQVCHTKINGLGFALESYDPVGRYRELDAGKSIDASGAYTDRDGDIAEFAGTVELANYLSTSDDAVRAFVSRAFHHFVKQPPAAFGPQTLDRLIITFKENDYRIRDLIVEIAVISSLATIDQESSDE